MIRVSHFEVGRVRIGDGFFLGLIRAVSHETGGEQFQPWLGVRPVVGPCVSQAGPGGVPATRAWPREKEEKARRERTSSSPSAVRAATFVPSSRAVSCTQHGRAVHVNQLA